MLSSVVVATRWNCRVDTLSWMCSKSRICKEKETRISTPSEEAAWRLAATKEPPMCCSAGELAWHPTCGRASVLPTHKGYLSGLKPGACTTPRAKGWKQELHTELCVAQCQVPCVIRQHHPAHQYNMENSRVEMSYCQKNMPTLCWLEPGHA